MIRDRISLAVSSVLTIGVLSIYSSLLTDFMKEFGYWLSLPLLLFISIGVFQTARMLDELIRPKSFADLENYDDHFPVPSVKAGDWDERLLASHESIAAAMHSSKEGFSKGFDLYRDDLGVLTAVWNKDGWQVRLFEPDTNVGLLAVAPDSKWADKQVPLEPAWRDIFKKEPEGRVDDTTAAKLAGHFMGWESKPENIAWCSIIEEE